MNKNISAISLIALLGSLSFSAHSALSSSANLFFSGENIMLSDVTPTAGSGSWMAFETGSNTFTYVGIDALNGILLGQAQVASGSHGGEPNGTEIANIDSPWNFFGNTGMHLTTSPITILSDDNNGNVVLDFTGWGVIWNEINPDINTGAWNGNQDGQANMRCEFDCSEINAVEFSEWFTLDYSATIPVGDPSGLGGIRYQLHLESVNYVPVPAAVWLFGSGLLLLAGLAKKKN